MKSFDILTEAIAQASQQTGPGITFVNGADKKETLSYQELYHRALCWLKLFQDAGLTPESEMVIQMADARQFLEVFWACLLGRIIPVPLSLGTNDESRRKLFNVWKMLNRPALLTTRAEMSRIAAFARAEGYEHQLAGMEKALLTPEAYVLGEASRILPASRPDDVAYLQFSSGSTGQPKGVTLTHRNLLTNIRGILHGIQAPQGADTFFSWMPLTHDMGLIGFHLTPLVAGWHHFIMPTELFIRNPSLWLQTIHRHRITFTASPNFGYRYVLDHFDPARHSGLDLSSLRVIVNGAEPISAQLCREFSRRMEPFGLKPNVIFPVYGLAEASLAVTFTVVENPVDAILLDRNSLNTGELVREAGGHGAAEFVNVGKPVVGTQLRITQGDAEAAENVIGRIQIKGDNVTSGYYNNPDETAKVLGAEGWLDTGDLGFLRGETFT